MPKGNAIAKRGPYTVTGILLRSEKHGREARDAKARSQELAYIAGIQVREPGKLYSGDGSAPEFDLRDGGPRHAHLSGGLFLRERTSLTSLFQPLA
jgi:hypothetical protein